jgi:hypothetical protein
MVDDDLAGQPGGDRLKIGNTKTPGRKDRSGFFAPWRSEKSSEPMLR